MVTRIGERTGISTRHEYEFLNEFHHQPRL